jgi:hypothetical protein
MTKGILENEVILGVGNLFSKMLCKCSSKDTTNLVEGFYENWKHKLYLKTFILNCQPISMYLLFIDKGCNISLKNTQKNTRIVE